MRALQDSAYAETRRLLRFLFVRHQQVPSDAAVWFLLRLTKLTRQAREAEAGLGFPHFARFSVVDDGLLHASYVLGVSREAHRKNERCG
jgi:hypothetical protein